MVRREHEPPSTGDRDPERSRAVAWILDVVATKDGDPARSQSNAGASNQAIDGSLLDGHRAKRAPDLERHPRCPTRRSVRRDPRASAYEGARINPDAILLEDGPVMNRIRSAELSAVIGSARGSEHRAQTLLRPFATLLQRGSFQTVEEPRRGSVPGRVAPDELVSGFQPLEMRRDIVHGRTICTGPRPHPRCPGADFALRLRQADRRPPEVDALRPVSGKYASPCLSAQLEILAGVTGPHRRPVLPGIDVDSIDPDLEPPVVSGAKRTPKTRLIQRLEFA